MSRICCLFDFGLHLLWELWRSMKPADSCLHVRVLVLPGTGEVAIRKWNVE